MFNTGPWQIALIILVVLLLFGGRKIPELARGMGRGIREFKEGLSEGDSKPKDQIESSTQKKNRDEDG